MSLWSVQYTIHWYLVLVLHVGGNLWMFGSSYVLSLFFYGIMVFEFITLLNAYYIHLVPPELFKCYFLNDVIGIIFI